MAIPAIVQATIDELEQLAAPLRTSTHEVARNLAAQIDALIARVEAGDPDVDLGSVGIILGAVNADDSDRLAAAAAEIADPSELIGALTDLVDFAEGMTDDEDDDEDDDYEDVIVPMLITTPDVTLTDALADDLADNLDQIVNATVADEVIAANGPRDLARGVLIEVTNPAAYAAPGGEATIGFIDTTNHGVVKVSITNANEPESDEFAEPAPTVLERAVASVAELDERELDDYDDAEIDPDRLELRLIADADTIIDTQVNVIVDKMGPVLAMLGDIVVDGVTVYDRNVATVPLRVNAHAPGQPALAVHTGLRGRGGDTIDGVEVSVEIVGVYA